MSQAVELSLLVPCLNEEENVEPVLRSLEDLRRRHGLADLEVVLLDDCSTDNTYARSLECAKLFPALNLRVLRRFEPRRGYGAVLRFGLAHARGTYAVPVAADMVDPIELIPRFLERARQGADLVQCSRYLKDGDADTIPFKYKFYQVIWRALVRLLLGQPIPDTTYAFRLFKRIDMLAVGLQSNRFSISPEILFKTMLLGGRIDYIPAGQGVRQKGKSKFIFTREGFGYGYVLLRAWLHKIRLVLWF